MDKLNKQVVNLDLSQELKKAGYPQEGLFSWVHHEDIGFRLHYLDENQPKNAKNQWNYFIASTVAELGEKLPNTCFSYYEQGIWVAVWDLHGRDRLWDTIEVTADTEADARAELWLKLKKDRLFDFLEN